MRPIRIHDAAASEAAEAAAWYEREGPGLGSRAISWKTNWFHWRLCPARRDRAV
jgi:hypothetical protein